MCPACERLNDYDLDVVQAEAAKTAQDHDSLNIAMFHALCEMVSEVGEVADQLKRFYFRNKSPVGADDFMNNMEAELGDVNWTVNNFATKLKMSMSNIVKRNQDKLFKRHRERLAKEGIIYDEGHNPS